MPEVSTAAPSAPSEAAAQTARWTELKPGECLAAPPPTDPAVVTVDVHGTRLKSVVASSACPREGASSARPPLALAVLFALLAGGLVLWRRTAEARRWQGSDWEDDD